MARPDSTKANPIVGKWRITWMENWDLDAIDLVGPGFIEFKPDGSGEFRIIAVRGWLDCRHGARDGRPLVEFSWDGADEGDQVCGRGWAEFLPDGSLKGHLFFHMGDDSKFTAVPFIGEEKPRAKSRAGRPRAGV